MIKIKFNVVKMFKQNRRKGITNRGFSVKILIMIYLGYSYVQ